MSLAQRTLRPSRRLAVQSRRNLAAPPPTSPAHFATGPTKASPPNVQSTRVVPTTATPTPISAAAAAGGKPVAVPVTPPPSAAPAHGAKKGGGFRRFVIYSGLLTATFYAAGTYAALQSPAVEDLFVAYVPGGERAVELAEERGWDRVGAGEVAGAASNLYKKVTSAAAPAAPSSSSSSGTPASDRPAAPGAPFAPVPVRAQEALTAAQLKAKEAQAAAAAKVRAAEADLGRPVRAGADAVEELAHAAAGRASDAARRAEQAAQGALRKAEGAGQELKNKALAAAATAKEALSHDRAAAAEAASGAQATVADAAGELKALVAEAEDALKGGFHTLRHKAGGAADAVVADAAAAAAAVNQAAPAPVKNAQGLTLWTAPLPLGFEPPPGYYVDRKPVAPHGGSAADGAAPPAELLPRLAPTLKAADPVISQLAGTFDELATRLSSVPSASTDAKALISTAQLDLDAIQRRLQTIKAEEEAALAKQVEHERQAFERTLREREVQMTDELEKREEGWKEVVEDERRRLVDSFRDRLTRELEVQQEIVNERLKEEVVAQGIELQRKWIREIQAHVETERGGRLAKLGELEGGLKQLEQVTLDNSKVLDENVRIHTIWTALRAVESALDQPRQPIADKLSALQHVLTSSSLSASSADALRTVLSTVPRSALTEGVESLPDLTYWFTSKVAPRIRSVALVPADEPSSGVLAHLTSAALSPLLFKKTGPVDGSDVGSVLARAEDRLVRRDLDGAAREVNSLQGWAGILAQDWLREARKRLELEQALDIVSTEAKLASLLVI